MRQLVKIARNGDINVIPCDIPEGISGIAFCQREKAIAFFQHQDGKTGIIRENGDIVPIQRRLEIEHPVCLYGDKDGFLVIQNSKDMGWNFDPSLKNSMRFCGVGLFRKMEHLFPENFIDYVPFSVCRLSKIHILMAAPWANKIVAFSNNGLLPGIGCGKPRYVLSGNLVSSCLNNPSGVCLGGNNTIFVSDTLNRMIRSFRNRTECESVGMPEQQGYKDGVKNEARLMNPGKIVCHNGRVVFIDGTTVRCFSQSEFRTETVYMSSGKPFDLAVGTDNVYVLEEQ